MTLSLSERALILAPVGRDAPVAQSILREGDIESVVCANVPDLVEELEEGAGIALVTEEAVRTADLRGLAEWLAAQPEWSDFPFILMTQRGGGIERNPAAHRLLMTLGNVTFLERPFHPTTLLSLAQAALRGRRRQYDARARLKDLHGLNETLEQRVRAALAEQRVASDALRQAQKMEAVGQLTGGVAHDFNNLLTVISGGLNMLERAKDAERIRLIKEAMMQAVDRGTALTRQLLAFSRNRPLETKTIDLGRQLHAMREILDRALRGDVKVVLDCTDGCIIDVDPVELELAVLNLCVNARDAMDTGGAIEINVAPAGESAVRLSVSDTGTGMSDAVKQRVFEPFFTTKEIGKGSGLGLAQVYGFAAQSNASIDIASKLGEGTRVTLAFPRSTKSLSAQGAGENGLSEPDAPLQARVLLVEDDAQVATLTVDMLHAIGCEVVHVPSAAAALEVLRSGDGVDIVFSDVMMPGGLSGVDLAKALHVDWPNVPVVLATGYIEAAREAVKNGVQVLEKPYQIETLEQAIRRELSEIAH